MLTHAQRRTLKRIHLGAKVFHYKNNKGADCYTSDNDGMRAVLYLTVTMRSLVKKGYVEHNKLFDACILTKKGLKAIGENK